jgi:phage gpG-like protein
VANRFGINTRIKLLGGELIFRVRGLDEQILALEGIRRRALDLRVPFGEFRSVWQASINDVFDAGGYPVPWEQLAPTYENWKSAHYPGQPILRATDRLHDSLTDMTSDTVWRVTPRTIQFGSRVPYFQFHQSGTSKMPARPPLVLTEEAGQALQGLVGDYVMGPVTR